MDWEAATDAQVLQAVKAALGSTDDSPAAGVGCRELASRGWTVHQLAERLQAPREMIVSTLALFDDPSFYAPLPDQDTMVRALREGDDRVSLLDQARYVAQLRTKASAADLTALIGRSPQYVYHKVRALKLPLALQKALHQRRIAERKAFEWARAGVTTMADVEAAFAAEEESIQARLPPMGTPPPSPQPAADEEASDADVLAEMLRIQVATFERLDRLDAFVRAFAKEMGFDK